MRGTLTACIILMTAALGASARAQDIPPPDILNSIIRQLAGAGIPPRTAIEFEPKARAQSAGLCRLNAFDMRLTRNGDLKGKYSVLIDSNPGNAGPHSPSEFFAVLTRVTVDADGSGRAYHPEDPEGTGVCQVQTVGGKTVAKGVCPLDKFSSGGLHLYRAAERLSKEALTREWQLIWPMIRDKKLKSFDSTQVSQLRPNFYLFYWRERNLTAVFRDTIVTRDNAGFPCRHGNESDHAGYFVAATTLQHPGAPKRADGCTPSAFIDAEQVPFIVLPKGGFGKVGIGDIAIARLKQGGNDRLVYGLVADAGPAHRLGEGSVALNAILLGKDRQPVLSMREAWALDISGPPVAMLVLGGTRTELNKNYSRANVETVARRAFERWGGSDPMRRFDACMAQADVNTK
jgi:hypothetical protein